MLVEFSDIEKQQHFHFSNIIRMHAFDRYHYRFHDGYCDGDADGSGSEDEAQDVVSVMGGERFVLVGMMFWVGVIGRVLFIQSMTLGMGKARAMATICGRDSGLWEGFFKLIVGGILVSILLVGMVTY